MKKSEKSNERKAQAGRSQRNEILVSIILSESTSSLLSLDVPNIEEFSDVNQSTCIIRPLTSTSIQSQKPSLFSYLFRMGKHSNAENNEISTEIAFFSDHFSAESSSSTNIANTSGALDTDWSDEDNGYSENEDEVAAYNINDDDEDDQIIEPMQQNLNATRVYVKPLLNAKTVAHENNISIEDNEILINLIDEDDNSSISSDLMCRICHGGESVGDLLKPCRCRGTIALAHVECLEHWLRESANSYCELCKHHFRIVRQPKYGVLWSIFVYLSSPGENFRDVIMDLIAFIFYTPSAIATTYMLMVICENMAKAHMNRTRNLSAHLVAFCAIFGMAAIDFTYSSWLILTFQRHALAWRSWYRNNSYLKLLLPDHKKKVYKSKPRQVPKGAHSGIANDPNIAGSVSA